MQIFLINGVTKGYCGLLKDNRIENVYPAAGLYFHVYDPYVSEIDWQKAVSEF